MSVLGSTKRPTPVKQLAVNVLKRISTPSFITFDMFSLVITYLFAVFFVHNNDDGLV